jgi:hypothetical protein
MRARKKILTNGIRFDPKTHELYRFFIVPVAKDPSKNASKRQIKKISFEQVDRIYIEVQSGTESMRFLGVFPTTYIEDRGWTFDYEAGAEIAPLDQGRIGLKLSGAAKNIFKKTKKIVWAHRTDRFVQWIYKKDWLEGGQELRQQIFCAIPKTEKDENRKLICSAKFSERDRSLARVSNRPIYLPA